MPSACETTENSSGSSASAAVSKSTDASSSSSQQQTNGQSKTTIKGSNGAAAAAAGFIDDDVDYEMPTRAAAAVADSTVVSAPSSPPSQNGEKAEKAGEAASSSADDFIFIQDTGFNVTIAPPGMEPFELQVSPLELVQEINHQLIDREDTCHRTCFSLQLDGVTLDNFSELKNIEGLKEGSVIRVVEEPYTVREARIHVRHVRDLLKSLDASDAYNGVDCSSLSFMNLIAQTDVYDSKGRNGGGGGGGRSAAASARNAADNSGQLDCLPPDFVLPFVETPSSTAAGSSNANGSSATSSTAASTTVPNGNAQAGQHQQQNGGSSGSSPPPSPPVPATSSSSPSSSSSASSNSVQLTPLIPQPRGQQSSQQGSPAALKVLTASGWNPPPGSRKLKGDLMYLYVVTLEEKRIHITASTRGFYVNLSTDEVFNPKAASGEPAAAGGRQQIFHSLVELLGQLSPTFRRNYSLIQRRRHKRHPFERLVTPYQLYSWAAPALEHTVDSIRAEDAFSSKLGYEEHMPGQTRDWNEELQTTRELPRKTLAERIIRERAIFKVHSDFVAAATRGAMAVVDGNVMALNPSEDTKMQMFIWNNIFFSLGFDVRDHYKELGGDAAAFAAPCNDLHGVRAYAAIDIEGLYTLATAVVDYKGYRVTAQSIIPGILERDQEQSVVYGSIDFGKTVVTNERYLELLNKAGQALKIVPHKVLSGPEDAEVQVEICSSVECKGIIGNDSRHYILDLLRTFPPDPHFVVVEEGDGQEKPELSAEMVALGFPRRHKHKLCSLRQELVDAFFESRYILFIKLAALYLQQSDIKKLKSGGSADAENAESAAAEEEKKAIEAAFEKLGEEDAADEEKKVTSTTTEDKEKKADEKAVAASIDENLKVSEDYKKLIESIASAATSPEKKVAESAGEQPAKSAAAAEGETPSEEVATKEGAAASGESDSAVVAAGNASAQQLSPRDLENTREIIRKAAVDVGSLSETEFDLRFNPDIYSPGVRHADVDGVAFAKQKKLIKDAAEFLIKSQIPSLIRDSLEHSQYLYDGLTLTEAMHSRGINIRYLGRVADLVAKHETLDYLMNIVVTELVCRSAKHLFTAYIQSVEVVYLSTAIAHFLNCLLSSAVANPAALFATDETGGKGHGGGKRKGKKNGNGGNGSHARSAAKKIGDQSKSSDWASLTARSLWSQLRAEMDAYYGWSAGVGVDSLDGLLARFAIQKISLLRLFSLRTGLQVLLREYHFEHRTRPAFSEEDILNVFPIVKHIAPRASDAYNFFQTGQRKIQEGSLREGYDYITEALNLFNNVYGPLHTDIVQCLRLLGRINYVLGDYQEACSFQQKAVLMSEKVNGIDHPHTITEYNFLALYSFSNQQISASLKFLYRARYLLSLIHGQNHPEMAIVDSNIGLILHAIGEYESSLRFLEHALALNLHYFGRRHLKVALSYHLVARTLSCMGLFRGALTNEKETYAIYKRELGEGHEKTKESSECLRHLTNQAVVLQKKMNEIYKGNVNTIIPPIQIQPPSISAVLEMLNVVNGILFLQISAADVENLKEMQQQQSLESAGKSTPTDKKDGEEEEEGIKAIKEAGDEAADHQTPSPAAAAVAVDIQA